MHVPLRMATCKNNRAFPLLYYLSTMAQSSDQKGNSASINPKALEQFRAKRKRLLPAAAYISGILEGDRNLLSQAITLIESAHPDHQKLARSIIEGCLPYSGNAHRIGITGVPGVGKSTFIEALGLQVVEKGHQLAVLAVDPSSEHSGGSILGDKTRMNDLSVHPNVYIRPSPSSGSLGGVARATRESMVLLEAAGSDIIFVETVGVGQSETTVHSMVDFFLLLLLAGAGDELQGIKRGIMEMADALLITKADGPNLEKARQARTEYRNALHLFPAAENGWLPRVEITSSLGGKGLTQAWEIINLHRKHQKANGHFGKRREKQARYWMHETIRQQLGHRFYRHPAIQNALTEMEKEVTAGQVSPFDGACRLLDLYFK